MAKKSAKAIESKPDTFSNPLLADYEIHADLKPLFDATISVVVWSNAIARCYPEMLALKDSCGMPKPDEWPDSPGLERNRAQHSEWAKATRAEYAQNGEDVSVADFLEPRWTELIREWGMNYRNWCEAIARAIDAAQSTAVAAIMDLGEMRPSHRWTTQTIIDLKELAGLLHPVRLGDDGFGIIRAGLMPLPVAFKDSADAIGRRSNELRSIPVPFVYPKQKKTTAPVHVVLWEGAEHTEYNIRLARTRTAYLEAHGDAEEAIAALKANEIKISRRTFYNHLVALDKAIPHWREYVKPCN